MTMPFASLDRVQRDLKSQLKAKSRARRDGFSAQSGSQVFASTRRNDMSPVLAITETPVSQLRLPIRGIRKNAAAHVKEVANSISALGHPLSLAA
jgi:hypothetical protein